jgi:hypothetical protein
MPDITALELQARTLAPAVSPRLVDHVLKFFSGALFSLALISGGTVVVIAALTVGVVGAPVIVVALAALALRRRRAPRDGALVTTTA